MNMQIAVKQVFLLAVNAAITICQVDHTYDINENLPFELVLYESTDLLCTKELVAVDGVLSGQLNRRQCVCVFLSAYLVKSNGCADFLT